MIPRNTITGQLKWWSRGKLPVTETGSVPLLDVFDSDNEFAVIPLENTIQGVVQETLQCFCEDVEVESSNTTRGSRWEIVAETDLPIQHTLVVRKETRLEDVTWVGSHEQVRVLGGFLPSEATVELSRIYPTSQQALGQCSNYLSKHLPHAERRIFVSTATAASFLVDTTNGEEAEEGCGAAICSSVIAEKLGDRLDIVEKGIQNVRCGWARLEGGGREGGMTVYRTDDVFHSSTANHTRFLLLRKSGSSSRPPSSSSSSSSSSPPRHFWILNDPNIIPRLGETIIAIHSRPCIRVDRNHASRYLIETMGRLEGLTLPDVRYLGSTVS